MIMKSKLYVFGKQTQTKLRCSQMTDTTGSSFLVLKSRLDYMQILQQAEVKLRTRVENLLLTMLLL